MKKKMLAAASLLLALLMPLGVTPLAVYADEGEGTTQGETAQLPGMFPARKTQPGWTKIIRLK